MKHKPGTNSEVSEAVTQTKLTEQPPVALQHTSLSGVAFDPKRILVPIDFSQCAVRALACAASLATSFQAKVILLHVVEPTSSAENCLAIPLGGDSPIQNLVQSSQERLSKLADQKLTASLRVETLVRIGRAHSEIADTAKALGVDLIVLAAYREAGARESLGTTAARVLLQAACPVLTIR